MNNLTKTYLVALTIIALVIGFSQFLVQNSIKRGSSDSRTINISGRQRMLSQKITKASLAMRAAQNDEQFITRKGELEKAYTLWSKSHQALQAGDESMSLVDVNNSESILELFEEISPYYVAIEKAVLQLLKTDSLQETQSLEFEAGLQQILANEGQFLKLMNDITFEYDAESTGRIKSLSVTEYILFAIAFFLLVMEGAFIFRPAIKSINDYTTQLSTALRKEEYLNNQSESIFENVKQGVFLIDKNLMIGDMYSKETDEIFETTSLQNTNFLKLMRPRLVKRDLEALEMFVDHLFNPSIRETVVNRLNPVEQVEIFPDKGSVSMDPRYIQMTFSRIMRDGEIYRVLVTVLDETETVRMRQRIEESDAQNEENYSQLLAILKVQPESLTSFLNESVTGLNGISRKYEQKDYRNFSDLVQTTYETVHSIKGNASLIGLEMISNSLHKVEDTIVELKNKSQIEGKHFLKIIYQIAEVITSLNNMVELQDKIASVYSKGSQIIEEKVSSSQQIKNAVETGLERISGETSKKVTLNFPETKVDLPEEYVALMKDIATQLIRNSIAHGIETAEERKMNQKSEIGTIRMALQEHPNGYTFDYADDGKGLDMKKILAKAIKNNLIARDEIPNLKGQDVIDLIFKKDFSTTLTADKYSGRGQGMTLVKSLVEKHNGTYKVGFKKGQSFMMRISLPKSRVLQSA
ncbi:type IV pili methyl-accepting chemotaxis transducer N-terminal domain-containing protein [Reichenbachiella versicolor]|uniref:type IV pili methyl-accepting chemotaxis transducer N-terminal domain-containing protein n=1 Tax=Reichenbachiella versicolor TaxID=1821036 RepID=UPI000D6EA4B9|nr:type IV pili methyl-accepting chemotaxis transducer N-terminal domain-containing protein [Reichenbachiella versicolor]